jgi:hypothetical protein
MLKNCSYYALILCGNTINEKINFGEKVLCHYILFVWIFWLQERLGMNISLSFLNQNLNVLFKFFSQEKLME